MVACFLVKIGFCLCEILLKKGLLYISGGLKLYLQLGLSSCVYYSVKGDSVNNCI